jgi:death-on-curing protein
MNNIKVNYTQQELIELGLKTAEGILKEKDIFNWINDHIIN